MKTMLGLLGGILFAGAALLFVNLAMAKSSQFLHGYDWIAFIGLYAIGIAIAMTAPTPGKGAQRLLMATGTLVCADALLIAVMGQAPLQAGSIGIAGGGNIAILFLVGLAVLIAGWFSGKSGH